jgi:hypothetical protein
MAGPSDAAAGALGALTGPIGEFLGGIKEVIEPLKAFVAALNPAAVVQLDQAFRNVMATVGQAFLPAIQIFTETLQAVAAVLDEPMRALAPVVEHLASIIRGVLIADAQQLGAVLTILGGVIETLAPLFEVLTEPVKISAAALTALAAVSKGVFEGLKPVVEAVATALKNFIAALVIGGAYVLKAFGAGQALDAFIGALEKQADPGRVLNAAPQNVSIKGLESITRDLATSAALAGAGEKGGPTTDEFVAQLANDLRDVKNNGKSFQDFLDEKIDQVIAAIRSLAGEAGRRLNDAAQAHGVNLQDPTFQAAARLARNSTPLGLLINQGQ